MVVLRKQRKGKKRSFNLFFLSATIQLFWGLLFHTNNLPHVHHILLCLCLCETVLLVENNHHYTELSVLTKPFFGVGLFLGLLSLDLQSGYDVQNSQNMNGYCSSILMLKVGENWCFWLQAEWINGVFDQAAVLCSRLLTVMHNCILGHAFYFKIWHVRSGFEHVLKFYIKATVKIYKVGPDASQ